MAGRVGCCLRHGSGIEVNQHLQPHVQMPKELKAAATAQAEWAGVSMNHYLLAIVAMQAVPGRALATLSWAGVDRAPEPGDELPPDLAERLIMKEPSAR